MGRAVIATRTASPPDFLRPGSTGLFTEVHDVEGLRAHILHLLEHPDEATEMGRQARALIVEDYSLERFCDRLESIVARSIEKRHVA